MLVRNRRDRTLAEGFDETHEARPRNTWATGAVEKWTFELCSNRPAGVDSACAVHTARASAYLTTACERYMSTFVPSTSIALLWKLQGRIRDDFFSRVG